VPKASCSVTHRARLRKTVHGKNLRFEGSFDRARAAWVKEFGGYPYEHSRFHLSTEQIDVILAAPKRPPTLAYWDASDEIKSLTWELHYSPVYRRTRERRLLDNAKRLSAVGEKFADVLFDESTEDLVLFAFPPGRLARLRQEIDDLLDYVEYERGYSKMDTLRTPCPSSSREKKAPSALESFIQTSLVKAYEKIYKSDAGRSRRRCDGAPSGPFIAFSTRFFKEVAYPVTAETIARALAPRWGK
jgi:hypothetical protein